MACVWIEAPFDSLPVEGYRKQRYWLMAEAFVAAGHEVVYWTSDFSHANKCARQLTGTAADFKLVLLKTSPYPKNICLKRIVSHRAYAREWRRQAEASVASGAKKPDLIIVAAPPVSTGAVAVRMSRRFGARLVIDVQDAWPETFVRLFPQCLKWLGRMLLESVRRRARQMYRAADLVTGVCDRYADIVLACGAKAYYRAYLGIDGIRQRIRTADEPGRIRIVYVGNLGHSYDLRTVMDGVRLLNSEPGTRATLEVAGFGGALDADDTVRFYGMLGNEELGRLLTACDIGVIPMRADSFVGIPNKLGEYAAAGLRVVSSLSGETAALVERYGCGITYKDGDAASFAAAVKRAMSLPHAAALELCEHELLADKIYREYVRRVEALWN